MRCTGWNSVDSWGKADTSRNENPTSGTHQLHVDSTSSYSWQFSRQTMKWMKGDTSCSEVSVYLVLMKKNRKITEQNRTLLCSWANQGPPVSSCAWDTTWCHTTVPLLYPYNDDEMLDSHPISLTLWPFTDKPGRSTTATPFPFSLAVLQPHSRFIPSWKYRLNPPCTEAVFTTFCYTLCIPMLFFFYLIRLDLVL